MIEIDIHKQLNSTDGHMNLHVKLSLEQGKLHTIYGPSGAGKTSTLRMIAGLMTPDNGNITVSGTEWYNAEKNNIVPPQKRRIGFVFQDFALFPNMSVYQNLEYAAPNKSGSSTSIKELIDIMELGDLKTQKPQTLSGGQKQRVALARAIVQQPQLLLLDEPLASLDQDIRTKLQDYLGKLQSKLNITTIMISHDIGEILRLSDEVHVIENGLIINSGSPEAIFIDHSISGKFKFTGNILSIQKEEVVYIVSVLVQNQIVKVICSESETAQLQVGDKVMVASKAFNPLLIKL